MEKQEINRALQEARKNSKKRKFTQSIDLIINLKNLNIKKEEERVLTFLTLPFQKGKPVKVTALVGKELNTKAKGVCNQTIFIDDFKKLDKKAIKKLAQETDFFVAQATIVPQVASTFGKILGPKGKMPNPKAGGIVPPTLPDFKPLMDKFQKTVKLETKGELTIKTSVGLESMKDEELIANYLAIYNHILSVLPQEKNNVKSAMIKVTMGKAVAVSEKKVESPKVEVKQ
jgi:large subunit ribosomal protein L1